MTQRTDEHRPSAVIPADYDFVSHAYFGSGLGDALAMIEERKVLQAHMKRTGGTYAHVDTTGNCQVCGNVLALYTLYFFHAKSNSYVNIGPDCAQKIFASDFGAKRFRTKIADARERLAGKQKAEALLGDAGLSAAWAIYKTPPAGKFTRDIATVVDMVAKLVRYGSISDKAVGFLHILIARIDQQPAIDAKRAAELAATPAVVSGRYEISGEVLKGEWRDSDYGSSFKITVKNAAGQIFWGTACRSLLDNRTPERGDKVSFVGTVEASADKPHFGFFKRPTGGVYTDEVNASVDADVAAVLAPDAKPAVGVAVDSDVAVTA